MSVIVNGIEYVPSTDGKVYGQYPLGDAPLGVGEYSGYSPTHYASASASGGGAGTVGDPWTLSEAMTNAVAGNTIGLLAGLYVGTGVEGRFSPAFQPTNSGTLSNPIRFVAQNSAAKNTVSLSEVRSGASTQGTGWPAFGCNGQDYVYWVGIKSDNTQANNKTDNDSAACVVVSSTGSKVLECDFTGEAGISDNYSGVRLEGTANVEVADNKISGYNSDVNSAGILVYKSNGFKFHHNTIQNCGNGVQLKGASGADTINNFEMFLNVIHDCARGFRLHGPVKGPSAELSLIYQNICYNLVNSFEFTSSATHTGEQDGLRVFNNVFYSVTDGDYWVNHNYNTEGTVPRDNTFFNNIHRTTAAYLRGTYTGASDIVHHEQFGSWERNCISNATVFGDGTASSALESLTFSAWQTTHSEDANSITSDPLFTNEVAQDFTLQGGSPCLNLGRDRLGKFGAVDATIDAGVYVSGLETIGVRP